MCRVNWFVRRLTAHIRTYPGASADGYHTSAKRLANLLIVRINAPISLPQGAIRMIEAELGRFGDRQLACVGGALLAATPRKRTFYVHGLAKDRNQAIQFGRFLANPAVTAHAMLAATGRLTSRRAAGRPST
jgi:hypothetical protein